MKSLVVFESMYGNTEQIADAIAEGLSSRTAVSISDSASAPSILSDDCSLLVVGGPTHAHGMSTPRSRTTASEKAEIAAPISSGLRDYLEHLGRGSVGAAAAFDTRFKMPQMVVGSAAAAAEKRLRKMGFRILVPARSFFVAFGATGPLLEGEVERARRWGAELGALAVEEIGTAEPHGDVAAI